MLQPIPKVLLNKSMTLKVPKEMDSFQNITFTEYEVNNVHLQNTNEVKKDKDNTEVVLRSILFIDSRLSNPKLDYMALEKEAEKNRATLRVIIDGLDYEVLTVDEVPNIPYGVHHYELGLV